MAQSISSPYLFDDAQQRPDSAVLWSAFFKSHPGRTMPAPGKTAELQQFRRHHETERFGKKHVYIDLGADRLFITTTPFNGGDNYSALLTHSKIPGYNHLFVNDPGNGFYLDDDAGAGYRRLIAFYVSQFHPSRVVIWGTSMGGYAALRWGLEFGTSVITNCPQVCLDLSLQHAWPQLREALQRIPQFVDVPDVVVHPDRDICIYYLQGRHPLDEANTAALLDHLRHHPRVHLQRKVVEDSNHILFFRNFGEFRAALLELETLRAAVEASRLPD